MDGGAGWATVHRVEKSQKQLSTHTHTHKKIPRTRKMLRFSQGFHFYYACPVARVNIG